MFNDPIIIIIFFIMILASTLQSLAVFGMGVIAAPVLVIIDPAYISAPILLMGMVLSMLNTYRYRNTIQLNYISIAILGRVVGSIVAIYLLSIFPPIIFTVCFSILIMISIVISYRHISINYSTKIYY